MTFVGLRGKQIPETAYLANKLEDKVTSIQANKISLSQFEIPEIQVQK